MPMSPPHFTARVSLAGSSSSSSHSVHQREVATPMQRPRGFSSPSGHASDSNSLRSALTHWSESDIWASLASTNHPNLSLASVSGHEAAESNLESPVVSELWAAPIPPPPENEVGAVQDSLSSPSSSVDRARQSCASPTLQSDRQERGLPVDIINRHALPVENMPIPALYEPHAVECNPNGNSAAQNSRSEEPLSPSPSPVTHPKTTIEEWQWHHIRNHTAKSARNETSQDPARITAPLARLNVRHHRASSQSATKLPTRDHTTRRTVDTLRTPSGVDHTVSLGDAQQRIAELTNQVLTLELELATLKAQKAQEALRCERQLSTFLARQTSPSSTSTQQSKVPLAILKDVISAYEGRFQDFEQSSPPVPLSTRDVGCLASDENITAASHSAVPAGNSPDTATELMELRQENTLLKLKLHAFNQPQSRETASREANIHASNDKRLLTRAFIHQDKQYWKYQLWKVDDMNPLDCKHLIKEFMLLFKVNDPRHLIAWLSLRRLRAAERRTRPA